MFLLLFLVSSLHASTLDLTKLTLDQLSNRLEQISTDMETISFNLSGQLSKSAFCTQETLMQSKVEERIKVSKEIVSRLKVVNEPYLVIGYNSRIKELKNYKNSMMITILS